MLCVLLHRSFPTFHPTVFPYGRVYWRAPDDKVSSRNDTRSTSLRIGGLRAGIEYECAVKAGNHYGSSQLTTPVLFVPGRIFVSSQSTDESEWWDVAADRMWEGVSIWK